MSVFGFKILKIHFGLGLFPGHLFIDFWLEILTFGIESIANIDFSRKALFIVWESICIVFWRPWERLFWFFRLWKHAWKWSDFWWWNRSWGRERGEVIYLIFEPSKDTKAQPDSWIAMTANWWKDNEPYYRSLGAPDKQGLLDFDRLDGLLVCGFLLLFVCLFRWNSLLNVWWLAGCCMLAL